MVTINHPLKWAYLRLVIYLVTILFVTGCADDSDQKPQSSLSARVTGENFSATTLAGYDDAGDIWIFGEDDASNGIEIEFEKNDVEEGKTYFIETVAFTYYKLGNEIFTGTFGEIMIKKISADRFEATFAFDAVNSQGEEINVTGGIVKVNLEPF